MDLSDHPGEKKEMLNWLLCGLLEVEGDSKKRHTPISTGRRCSKGIRSGPGVFNFEPDELL